LQSTFWQFLTPFFHVFVRIRVNLALQQFCAHKAELLRVLDTPQVQGGLPGEASPGNTPPLHTNAAEADIRSLVTRRKISGGERRCCPGFPP
jgi:hypothetical protein